MQILNLETLPQTIGETYKKGEIDIKYGELHSGYGSTAIKVHRTDGMTDIWRIIRGEWERAMTAKSLPSFEPLVLQTVRFTYLNAKDDYKPIVLILGQWMSGTKTMVCGVNVNTLNRQESLQLKQIIRQMTFVKTLQGRVEALRKQGESIFQVGYRTYDANFIRNLEMA